MKESVEEYFHWALSKESTGNQDFTQNDCKEYGIAKNNSYQQQNLFQ